jgi:hypothetical protein
MSFAPPAPRGEPSDKTKRTLGTIIVLSVFTLAVVLTSVSIAALVVRPELFAQAIQFTQVLIASCISGILGIAVGIGIGNNKGSSDDADRP